MAAKRNIRKIAIRHQPSSRLALTRPAKLSITTISGNSNATPNSSITLVTKSK